MGWLRMIPSKLALAGVILVALAGVGWFAWGEYQHQIERADTAEHDRDAARQQAAQQELIANAWQQQAVRLRDTVEKREQDIADLQKQARDRQDEIDRIRESTSSADWAGTGLPYNVIEFVRQLTAERAAAGGAPGGDSAGVPDGPDTGTGQ